MADLTPGLEPLTPWPRHLGLATAGCPGCPARYTGIAPAHCDRCHASYASGPAFRKHSCLYPGARAIQGADGIWRDIRYAH